MFLNERRVSSLLARSPRAVYHDPAHKLYEGMTLSTNDRRMAWESARDDAHLAFRVWCHAPYGTKREAYTAYRAAADREDSAAAALMTA
jgi:hypothetical protein